MNKVSSGCYRRYRSGALQQAVNCFKRGERQQTALFVFLGYGKKYLLQAALAAEHHFTRYYGSFTNKFHRIPADMRNFLPAAGVTFTLMQK